MTDNMSRIIMANNIKRYMESKGVTNQQLCTDLGFKYTTFRDWIKSITYPRIEKIEAMAAYFGCEKSDLIEDKSFGLIDCNVSENRQQLIKVVESLPEDKLTLALKLINFVLEDM